MAPLAGKNASKKKSKANHRHDLIVLVVIILALSLRLFYMFDFNKYISTIKFDISFSETTIKATDGSNVVEESTGGAHLRQREKTAPNIKRNEQESEKVITKNISLSVNIETKYGNNVIAEPTSGAHLRKGGTMEMSATPNTKIEQELSEKVIMEKKLYNGTTTPTIVAGNHNAGGISNDTVTVETTDTDGNNVIAEPTSGAHLRKGETMEMSATPNTKIEQESSEKVTTNEKKKDPLPVYGAACLLIKDDNTKLIEWLAYHYTRLPLRYLVVAVDPDSETSPETILERWKYSRKTDLEYILWNDSDYMTPINMTERDAAKDEIHRQRQRQFLSNCYRHHKSMDRSWVIHIDVDEYVLFNNKRFDEPWSDENGKPIVPNPERGMLPTFGKRKKILDVIATYPNVFGTCVGMVRLLFGNKREESSSIPKKFSYYDKKTKANQNFDLDLFDTLRYSYHHPKGLVEADEPGTIFNGWGKVMLDVSKLSWELESENLNSINRPIQQCPKNWVGPEPYVKSLLRVNHYLGSWDAHNSGADSRRSRDIFDAKANAKSGPSYDIRPWLEQFIGEVGIDEAKRLLDGIGDHQRPKKQFLDNGTTTPTIVAGNHNAGGISNGNVDENEDDASLKAGASEESNPYNYGVEYDYRECTSPESHVPFPLEGDVHSKTSSLTCGMRSKTSNFTSFFEGSLWKQKFQPLIRKCTKLVVFGVAFGGNFVKDLDAPHVQSSVNATNLIERHGRCFFILTTEDDIERNQYNSTERRSLNDPISVGHNILIPLPKTVLPYNNPRRNVKLLKYMGQYMFQDSETVVWQDAKFFRGDFVSKQPVDYADLIEKENKDSCVLSMGLPVHKNTVGKDNIEKGILFDGRYRPQYEHHCQTIITALAKRPDVTDSSENLIRQCKSYLQHVHQKEGNIELMNQGLIDSAFIVWNQKTQSCRDFASELRCTIVDQIHCHSDRDQVSIPFALFSMGVSGMYRKRKGESLKAVDESWDPTNHDLDFVSKTNNEATTTSLGRSKSQEVMFRVTRSSCHWYFSRLGNCTTDDVN